MMNPDWTYNYLAGAQSAANLQAVIPDDDADTLISVASLDSEYKDDLPIIPISVYKSTSRCFISNVVDGLLIGAITAGAFSVFPPLVRGKIIEAFKAPFNRGNLKISIFFGLLLGVYNTGRFHVRTSLSGHKPSQRVLRALVAISIGYSASLLSNRVRKFIALFLLSRAIETKSKDMHRKISPMTREKIKPLVDNADTALSAVSMAVNSCAWIMAPELLDKSYLRFLDSNCGYTVDQLRNTTRIFSAALNEKEPVVVSPRHCQVLHEDAPNGCTVEVAKFAARQYVTGSIPFYYKLYAIPLLITTIKSRKVSLTALRYFVQRTARSSLYFTSGGVALTSVFCLFSKFNLPASPMLPIIGGLASGGLVVIEPKSRRIELGLYLLTQAMHVFAMFYSTRLQWWYPPGVDLLAVAVGFYQMASAYEQSVKCTESAGLLRPFYVTILRKIFDFEDITDNGDIEDRLHSWSVTKYI